MQASGHAKIAPHTHDAFRLTHRKLAISRRFAPCPVGWWQELPSTTTGGSQNLSPALGALGYNVEIFGSSSLDAVCPEFPMVRGSRLMTTLPKRWSAGCAGVLRRFSTTCRWTRRCRAKALPSWCCRPTIRKTPDRPILSPQGCATSHYERAHRRPVPPAPRKPAASARKPWWRKLVA